MNELTYTRCGDYYIPDLKLSEQPEAPIGKYGRMRQRYLKEHRPSLYSSLILSEKLYPHLLEIDRAARERMDAMLPRMMEAAFKKLYLPDLRMNVRINLTFIL